MKVRVAQCWDDGVYTDLNVIEILRKYGAKATFNLNPGCMEEERIPASWCEDVAKAGWFHGFRPGRMGLKDIGGVYRDFQVASHAWTHDAVGYGPTDEECVAAAVKARNYLEDVLQRPCPGYAWPMGSYSEKAMGLMHEAGFAYGRTTKNVEDVTAYEDSMALHPNCHFLADDFIQRYERAKKTGVFYFWGHSYEMMDCQGLLHQFELKIKYITEDPDAEWVDVIDLVR